MIKLFINGKPALINGLRKFKNPSSWLVFFLVVLFNEIAIFFKDSITFAISFISLFVRFIPELFMHSLLHLSFCLSRKNFSKFQAMHFPFLATLHKIFPKIAMSGRTPPNCTILDNWVFLSFTLTDESFAKALQIFEICVSVNSNLWGKLISPLEVPVRFDGSFKVTSVPFLLQILTY